MRSILGASVIAALVASLSGAALASDSTPVAPSGAMGATFNYAIGVQTIKGKKSDTGQISIKPAGAGKLTLTVTASDGTTKTIPLVVSNGKVSPAMPAPAASPPAAAQTLMANMKLAASVGMAAKKSEGKGFTVPVLLTPIGGGTAVSTQLSMTPKSGSNGTSYSGSVSGSTTTTLPPNSGNDAGQIAKGATVGAVSAGMTPAGRIATAVAAHRREEQMKQAEEGPLPDSMSLTITATFSNGGFHDISGTQVDTLSIAGRPMKVTSTWSFTKASP